MHGFSTIEIIIAIAIMATTLSAVVLVSFGDQALLEQAGMDSEAVEKAQVMLGVEQDKARKDFRLVNNIATTSDSSYRTSLSVSNVAADPFTTKRVTVIAQWDDERHVTRDVALSEIVTDFDDPFTLDTCDSSLSGNWNAPAISNHLFTPGNMLPTNAKIAAVNTIGAVDAYRGKLYVVDSSRSSKINDSLFIFDLSNPTSPTYLGSTDTATSTVDGMNAIVVEQNFAFAANAHSANFKTCKPGGNCSQLQIFNVADPSSPVLVDNFLLPTSSAPFVLGSGGQAIGNALFYTDGYIYLGLSKTSSGPEFNIVDVHDPAHPAWIGGYTIGATINQIYVHNGIASIASDDQSRKMIVLNVADPHNPYFISSIAPHGTSNQEYGYSLYTVGDEMFFGMSST